MLPRNFRRCIYADTSKNAGFHPDQSQMVTNDHENGWVRWQVGLFEFMDLTLGLGQAASGRTQVTCIPSGVHGLQKFVRCDPFPGLPEAACVGSRVN